MFKFLTPKFVRVLPVIVFLLCAGVLIAIAFSYKKKEELIHRQKVDLLTIEVSQRVHQFLETRMQFLQLFVGHIEIIGLNSEARFKESAAYVQQHVKGFVGIDWVSPEGVVTWMEPEKINSEAIGKNLLNYDKVRDYVILSKERRKPMMSHFIKLYMGPMGLVLYNPLWFNNQFKGWINGILLVDHIKDLLTIMTEKSKFQFKMTFTGLEGALVFGAGDVSEKSYTGNESFPFLNMQVNISLRLSDQLRQSWLNKNFILICLLAVSIALLIALLTRQVLTTWRRVHQQLQKEQHINTLMNTLCHDLASPLMTSRFALENVLDQTTGLVKTNLERVYRGILHQTELLASVREMRALEMGTRTLELQPVDMNRLLEDIIALFAPLAAEKRIQLEFKSDEQPLPAMVNPLSLQHNIMGNLLSNAIKFSELGSKVNIHLARENGWVHVRVQDHGIGMPKHSVTELTGHKTLQSTLGTQGEAGYGFGLMQVRSYMSFHGGKVHVTSSTQKEDTKNHGTTVDLYFRAT